MKLDRLMKKPEKPRWEEPEEAYANNDTTTTTNNNDDNIV